MFVDMNSFFASCEQQVNYWLRHRPMGVCVYTGRHGAVIALSREAKKLGLKPGRLDEIMQACPQFIPVETHPKRYREFHVKIIKVLRGFSEDVIPKSIDEAVINFSSYGLMYKDLEQVAMDIKKKIIEEVGDWLTCSIGLAPNGFLAKLASDIKKPDGLTVITPDNIDAVLDQLSLTDLPGIGQKMALRMVMGGIRSPLQLRHTPPEKIRSICHSIVGEYWHYRLHFKEVDIATGDYKSMQAMRQVSKEQRRSLETLLNILRALCLQLEKRMVNHQVAARFIACSLMYEDGTAWSDSVHTEPVQHGIDLLNIILSRIKKFDEEHPEARLINHDITRMSIFVNQLVGDEIIQLSLFESKVRRNTLLKEMYHIKEKFGFEKIGYAGELTNTPVMKDVIGFGSVKDLIPDNL